MPSTLTIQPWPDAVIDTVGHDPRSLYAETFWLPTLGPTALLLLRHLACKFDERPGPLELPVAQASQALGLGERAGTSSPIVRSLVRLESFELACSDGRRRWRRGRSGADTADRPWRARRSACRRGRCGSPRR